MKNRILAAILSALMLLPATACGTDVGPSDTSEDTARTEAETVDENFPDFQKQDYNGDTFCIINRGVDEGKWYFAEEYKTTGQDINVLNNTLYEMNTLVEEYLNINMEYVSHGSMYDAVYPTIMAGDDTYQACFHWAYWDLTNFITKNIALDLYEMEGINLNKPYWNREIMDMLAVGDHAYIGTGDICYQVLYMLYANKDMLREVSRDMPYDAVRNGQWTLDMLISLTADLYADNGDGQRNPADVFGFAADWNCLGQSLAPSSDLYVATKNRDGDFELTLYNDRLIELVDKTLTWSQNESTWVWGYGATSDTTIDFAEQRTYVTAGVLGPYYLGADFKVGILPLPKYDVSQENYAHLNWGNSLNVLNTVRNREMVGQALELMSYYTSTLVLNKYYDEVLQLRVSEAPDDRDMVELIYNTVVYDPGFTYCDGNDQLRDLHNLVYSMVVSGDSNVASYYQGRSRSAAKWLDKLNKIK